MQKGTRAESPRERRCRRVFDRSRPSRQRSDLRTSEGAVQLQVNVLAAFAQFEVFPALGRFFGKEGQQVEDQVQADFPVLDGDAELSKALQVLSHALDLTADEFIGFQG